MSLIPLAEGRRIDLDDRRLDEGVRPDKLVVRGVVHDTDDTGLLGSVFASPSKVARVETEGTVLEVAPTNTDRVDPLGAELGVGGLTTELELSLLAVVGALSTGR